MTINKRFNKPEYFLMLMAIASSLAFSVWLSLLNNFAIENVAFSGREIGILQSLREIPGFLAFTAVLILLILREQIFALLAVIVLGIGVAITGFLPSEYGLYFTTILMSIGFHYYYTLQQSLTLQWISKKRAPIIMGRLSSASSIAAVVAFGSVWLGIEYLEIEYRWLYLAAGGMTVILGIVAWIIFPHFPHKVPQHKHLLMRRRYWLYYALTFMGGARRQIFIVFASFLMVEKFGFTAANIALLFLVNHSINTIIAPRIGQLIVRFGERRILTLEYVGLIIIFTAYAFVDTASIAAILYVVNHLFYSMAIAIRTYFQKIADPADIASTASVSFTINHIAAVVIPASFGILWLFSPALVFLSGSAIAVASLVLARLVPNNPCEGNEVKGKFQALVTTESNH